MRGGIVICTIVNGPIFDGMTTDPMQAGLRLRLCPWLAQ
jgi:hypothetical protein